MQHFSCFPLQESDVVMCGSLKAALPFCAAYIQHEDKSYTVKHTKTLLLALKKERWCGWSRITGNEDSIIAYSAPYILFRFSYYPWIYFRAYSSALTSSSHSDVWRFFPQPPPKVSAPSWSPLRHLLPPEGSVWSVPGLSESSCAWVPVQNNPSLPDTGLSAVHPLSEARYLTPPHFPHSLPLIGYPTQTAGGRVSAGPKSSNPMN